MLLFDERRGQGPAKPATPRPCSAFSQSVNSRHMGSTAMLSQPYCAQSFPGQPACSQNTRRKKRLGIGRVPPPVGFSASNVAEKCHAADGVRFLYFAEAGGIVVIADPGSAVALLRRSVAGSIMF